MSPGARRCSLALAADADVLVMAAAVADFRPAEASESKMKKSDDGSSPVIVLERTEDVLATAVRTRAAGGPMAPLIVGFAAETGDAESSVLEYGRAKLARKGCDLLVVNEVGVGVTFGQDASTVHLLRPGVPGEMTVGPADKGVVAHAILDVVRDAIADA